MARKGERDPKREQFWRAALRRRQQSGLTVREFCRREQLSETAYHFWRREIARRDREPRPRLKRERARALAARATRERRLAISSPLFQELAIISGPSPGADHGVEVVLPDGCRVRMPAEVDRALLADVLSVLEARRC
jgi:hypothetical protein